jgi:hypothetical protein
MTLESPTLKNEIANSSEMLVKIYGVTAQIIAIFAVTAMRT